MTRSVPSSHPVMWDPSSQFLQSVFVHVHLVYSPTSQTSLLVKLQQQQHRSPTFEARPNGMIQQYSSPNQLRPIAIGFGPCPFYVFSTSSNPIACQAAISINWMATSIAWSKITVDDTSKLVPFIQRFKDVDQLVQSNIFVHVHAVYSMTSSKPHRSPPILISLAPYFSLSTCLFSFSYRIFLTWMAWRLFDLMNPIRSALLGLYGKLQTNYERNQGQEDMGSPLQHSTP